MNFLDPSSLPWAIIAAWLASQVIPYLSALATTVHGWWTTALTALLSFIDAFFANLAVHTDLNAHNWKNILVATFVFTASAYFHHFAFIRGTKVQPFLLTHGISGGASTQPAAA